MIPALVPLGAAAALWTAVQGTLLVSESTHGSARNEPDRDGTGYDIDEVPIAALTLAEGKTAFTVGYAPQLTLRDVFRPELRATTFLHNGYLSFGLGGPDYRLTLTEAGSFGTQSFTGLRTTPLDPTAPINPATSRVDYLPSVQTVPTASLSSAVAFDYDWNKSVRSSISAGYATTGGRGAAAEMVLARQNSVSGALSTDVKVTHFDRVGVRLDGTNAVTTSMLRHEYLLITGTGSWDHTFWTGFTFQLVGGGTGTRAIEPNFTPLYSLAFTGATSSTLELIHQRGLLLSITGGGSVAPVINHLNGILQRRLQGTGSILLRIDDFSLTANGDAAQTLPLSDHSATRIFGVGGGAGYAPGKYVLISAEFRTARQSSRDRAFDLQRQWAAIVGLTLRAPPQKF